MGVYVYVRRWMLVNAISLLLSMCLFTCTVRTLHACTCTLCNALGSVFAVLKLVRISSNRVQFVL